MKNFALGTMVAWNTPQGETRGRIVKKVTNDTTYQGLQITASRDNPRYIVQSDTSGKFAAHKPDSLIEL